MAITYRGEGLRVKKLVGENTRFVYGIGGELIAEFDGVTGNLKKEYVYGGASLITIEPTSVNSNGTQYTTADKLGSPRVITKSDGTTVSRHDYMPFGTELGTGVGGRTTGMGFSNGGDTNRKKFTGYERDAETGLDFAQARYYSNTQGRFTSPDPLQSSAKLTDPQSFNRYTYVGNNPMVFADPFGMERGHSMFLGNRAEIDHAREVGQEEVAEQEAYYEDRLPGKYDSIVITVEPIDGALDQQQAGNANTGTEPQDTVKVQHNDPIILGYSVKYLNKTPQGEVPVGGQFQIKYKYSISIPTDGSKPEEAGRIEPVGAKGSFTDAFGLGIAAELKIKVNIKKESVEVEKIETFVVAKGPKLGANATGALNYTIAVTAPNKSGTITRSPVSSWRKPLFGKGPPDPIMIRNVPLQRPRKAN